MNSPDRHSCFFWLLTIACVTTVVTDRSRAEGNGDSSHEKSHLLNRPNVILILADDLGVEGLNCYGGTSYRTPNLDRLATQGMRFTQVHAQPLCTNTRVQLMTGLYNHRNWLYFGCLDPGARTIGHFMQEAGYQTCIAGKWQLYSYDPPEYPGAALRRGKGMPAGKAGFHQYSLWHTGHTENKGSRYADPVIDQNGELLSGTRGKYGEDLWVEFINQFMTRKVKQDQPFFVYYPMALPHWPFVPTPDSQDWGIREKMHPPLGTTGGDAKYFPDMVNYMDKTVGRIVDAVEKLGIREKTLILFMSDNGTDRKVVSETLYGRVQGGKGLSTDAGTHVPLIASWPGTIRPGLSTDLVDSTDILPTLLDFAVPGKSESLEIDGVSFAPRLLGQKGPRREWSYCYYDPRPGWDKDRFGTIRFARTARFKLYGDGRLYDVANDRLEARPLLPADETRSSGAARQLLKSVLDSMHP